MHELGIATSILDIVTQRLQEEGLSRVKKVHLVVGEMSQVVPDALSFAWEAITKDTPAEGALLEIEERPIRARCHTCQQEFQVENFRFICPGCGGRETEMIAGDELFIEYLEAD